MALVSATRIRWNEYGSQEETIMFDIRQSGLGALAP